MISKDKKYKFKGFPYKYELIATDIGGNVSVVGKYLNPISNFWVIIYHNNDGRYSSSTSQYTDWDLIEVGKYDHLKKDDPVVCYNEDHPDKPQYRYFSHVNSNGRPCTFLHGATSWSAKEGSIDWDHCELFTENTAETPKKGVR